MTEPAAAFTRVRQARASTDVITQIREAILSGRYAAGVRLPTEREMAKQFGVSRVTIRDALRAVEASGLVEIRVGGQGGPYVRSPDPAILAESLGTHFHLQGTTFAELAEARLAIETTATRLAAERATEEDLSAMRAAIDEAAGEGSATASVDFHTALVRSSHNSALLTMFLATRSLLSEAFDTLHSRQPDMAVVAHDVHLQLYHLIAAGKADAAVRKMREHLYEFAERAERAAQAAARARARRR